MFRIFAIIFCLLTWSATAVAQPVAPLGDSIRVTLLTCSPGPEVYELYGHTAIRCQAPSGSTVFNYGVFDMSKPYFVWNFVLGHTDYMVCPVPWEHFAAEYRKRGSSITEQELNLTPVEARRLTERLVENCRPENRTYRYNYLYKNCTTMVRDMVEQVVMGEIHYPDTLPHQTYREILHHYTAGHPWAQEGNDLLLGSEVDTILSARAAMFVPENMMHAFDGAFIRTPRGDMRPLVRSKAILVEASPVQSIPSEKKLSGVLPIELVTSSPLAAMLALGAVCLLIMLLEVWTRRSFWLWDVLLLLAQGAAGLLLAFMLLFSQHPAVGSNWQIWVLNPLALVGIPFVIKAAIRHRPTLWFVLYFAVLALFLLFSPWIPQVFAKITVPLALCLLTRPISYYYVSRRKKKHDRK